MMSQEVAVSPPDPAVRTRSCFLCARTVLQSDCVKCRKCRAIYYCSTRCRDAHANRFGHAGEECSRAAEEAAQRKHYSKLLSPLTPDLVKMARQRSRWMQVRQGDSHPRREPGLWLAGHMMMSSNDPKRRAPLTFKWKTLQDCWSNGLGRQEAASLLQKLCETFLHQARWNGGSMAIPSWAGLFHELRRLHRVLMADWFLVLRLCLDAVMTVHHAIECRCHEGTLGRGSPLVKPSLRVHVLGVEWEVDSWPLFAMLSCMWPDTDLHFTFIGRDILEELDGQRVQWQKCPDESNAKWLESLHGRWDSITLGRGLYHDWQRNRQEDPDLVVALNAGLAAYQEWGETLQVIGKFKGTRLALFTDYTREAAVLAKKRIIAETGADPEHILVDFNNFAQPYIKHQPDSRLPAISNGFSIAWWLC